MSIESGFLSDLNLDGVEADPNYIADGVYHAFVYESEVRTKKDGTPSWVLTYKIAPDEAKHAGQQIAEWFDLKPVGPNANLKKSFMKRRVLSLGVPESRINAVNPADFVGTEVAITVKHKGQYQNVTDVKLAEGGAPQPKASIEDLI